MDILEVKKISEIKIHWMGSRAKLVNMKIVMISSEEQRKP